jgi:hypothetical protein
MEDIANTYVMSLLAQAGYADFTGLSEGDIQGLKDALTDVSVGFKLSEIDAIAHENLYL